MSVAPRQKPRAYGVLIVRPKAAGAMATRTAAAAAKEDLIVANERVTEYRCSKKVGESGEQQNEAARFQPHKHSNSARVHTPICATSTTRLGTA